MRAIAHAWATAFGVGEMQDFDLPREHAHLEPISFNRPYPGGHEVHLTA